MSNHSKQPAVDAQAFAGQAQEHLDRAHRYSTTAETYALEGIGYALLAIREQLVANALEADESTAYLVDHLTKAIAATSRRPRRGRSRWRRSS